MVRPTVDTSLPTVALQPQAAPVDTYVRPAQDNTAGSDLMDIARSLAGFSKPLGDLVAQRDQKAKDEDSLRAQRDFVANNSLGYDEAVKRGLIPASASPTYVSAWKKAQGDVAGSQLEQEALAAYEQSPLKNSTDPNAIGQFVSGFLKDRMGTTDPEVLKGLMPRVYAIRNAIYNRHLQDQDTKIKSESQNLLGAQGANALDDAHAQGLASGEPNYAGAFKAMQDKRAAFTGMSDDEANKVLFDTVTEKAISNNDPKILDFFDLKVPGKSYSYKDTPDGLKAYNNAIEKLDVISRRNKVEAHQAQEAADKAAKEKSEADALDVIAKNPNAPLPDEVNAAGRKYDGGWEAKVLGWRTAFKNAAAASDPYALAEVQKDIMDDPANAPRFVVEALNKGVLSASDFQSTYKFAKDVQTAGGEYGKVESNPAFTATMGAIKDRTAPGSIDFTKRPNWSSDDSFRAQSDFRRQVFEWAKLHPEDAKDPLKLNKAIEELGAGILGHITSNATTGGKYIAEGSGEGNPYGANPPPPPLPAPDPKTQPLASSVYQSIPKELGGGGPSAAQPQVQPGAQPPAAPTAPTQPAQGPTPQEVDSWLKSQSPVIQQTIQGQAAKSKDPEAFKRGVMEKFQRNMQQLQGGQPAAPAAQPGQQSSGQPYTPFIAVKDPPGLLEAGNIDLTKRPRVKLPDGSTATVRSSSFELDGKEVLLPTVTPDGKLLSNQEAIQRYRQTGEHLGKFDNPDDATAYAQALHLQQEKMYVPEEAPSGGTAPDGTPAQKSSFTGATPISAFADTTPGQALDNAISDPQGALGAIQDAIAGQTTQDELASTFDEAFHPRENYRSGSVSMAGNSKAGALLDFISRPESGGNYNAVFGNARSSQDLSQFTLNQVLKMQQDARTRGAPSTAIGRYQFIRGTLMATAKELGLTGNEQFTPELQDRLAMRLLQKRGYDDWASGKMSDQQFANNLSKEWASLPVIGGGSHGKSFYAGDGLNKAGVSPGQVMAALSGATSMSTAGDPSSAPAQVSRGVAPRSVPAAFTYGNTSQDQQPIQSFVPGLEGRTATADMKPVSAIVMHVTGKPDLQSELDYMASPDKNRGGSRFGYHFLIDKDGKVYQTAPLNVRTNHVKGNQERGIDNRDAVGIAFVGGNKGATPEQIQAGIRLARGLQQQFGIGDDRVVSHGEIQADRAHGLGPAGMDSEAQDFMQAFRGSGTVTAGLNTKRRGRKSTTEI